MLSAEKPRSVLVWLGKSPSAKLLTRLAGLGQPITHELLDTEPADQALNYLRQLLVHPGVLATRIEHLDRLAPWLDQELTDRPATHVRLIRPFATWDRLHRARRAAAAGVTTRATQRCGSARKSERPSTYFTELDRNGIDLAENDQSHLDRWLNNGPPARRSARPFVAGLSPAVLARAVDIPPPVPASRQSSPTSKTRPPNSSVASATKHADRGSCRHRSVARRAARPADSPGPR